MRSRKGIAVLLTFLAVAAGGAGCGKDEESGGPSTTTATAGGDGMSDHRTRTARGVPLQPGGDNSIQLYGSEADASTRKKIAPILDVYANAYSRSRWPVVCSYLSRSLLREIQQFVAGSKSLADAGCARTLATLNRDPSHFARSQRGQMTLLSVRLEGGSGFAIFRPPTGVILYLPVLREDREWKVGAVGPSPLLG